MSFKDTFTKEDKASLLNYDDGAFYYFAATSLAVFLIPLTLTYIKRKFGSSGCTTILTAEKLPSGEVLRRCGCSLCAARRQEATKRLPLRSRLIGSTRDVWLLTGLAIGWCAFLFICLFRLQMMQSSVSFDPFEILNITEAATEKQIKKAFRTMSLKYHPDKNKNDPASAAKFMLISKAYTTLTDETAKRNFEKYGNPDGAGMMKVGIGLPLFLVTEKNQIFILAIFFMVLLIVVPAAFITYYHKIKQFAPNGLKHETINFVSGFMSERTPPPLVSQFVAASAEARAIGIRETDIAEMEAVKKVVRMPPPERMFRNAIVQKNILLLSAHLQRKSDSLSPNLRRDMEQLLKVAVPVTKGMIDIAFLNNWIPTIQAISSFRKGLFQALDMGSLPLMQWPHTTEERAMQVLAAAKKYQPKDTRALITLALSDRANVLKGYTQEEIDDIVCVFAQMPDIELTATVETEDEAEICVGDISTCKLTFTRKHLKEGEAQGPIHAPHYPEPRFEEWFFFITDAKTSQLYGCKSTKSLERVVEVEVQFPVTTEGKKQLFIVALCDSYFGMDGTVTCEFEAVTEDQTQRRIFIHPEDLALDNQPTLYQQMIGGNLEGEADSDEDEDETKEVAE